MTDDNGAIFSQELLNRIAIALERAARALKRHDELTRPGSIINSTYAPYVPDPIDFKEISNVKPIDQTTDEGRTNQESNG